jgi:outer membrane usher protein
VVLILALWALTPHRAIAADEPLLLEVQINGFPTGKIGEVTFRDGALLARRSELQSLGLRPPAVAGPEPDPLIALSDLPGLAWRIDQPNQMLYITATDAGLATTRLTVKREAGGRIAVDSGLGATLNYDVSALSAKGNTTASGLFDLRLFSPAGVISSGLLIHAAADGDSKGVDAAGDTGVRLDSTYTFSDPMRLRRYRVGDFIAGDLGWTRSVRLGGVQISSDFSLRPDLITFPLPTVSGSVALPSTVDVLVNGARSFTGQVAPGRFEIPTLPVITGGGLIAMTITDALGRQTTQTMPFFSSAYLLSRGLQTFSAQLGLVRRNWGTVSSDYGAMAAVVTYRRGLSSQLTVEASAEGAEGTVAAGAGVVADLHDLAVLNASVSGSTGTGRNGMRYSIGLQHTGQRLSAGVFATFADHGFADVAAVSGEPAPRMRLTASASAALGRFGSLGIAYASTFQDAVGPTAHRGVSGNPLIDSPSLADSLAFVQPAQHARILTASYSAQVANLSVFVTAFHDFSDKGADGMSVGLTLPLGQRSSVSVTGSEQQGGALGDVEIQQSATSVGDWGYQLYGGSGPAPRGFAQLQYKSAWNTVTAGVDQMEHDRSLRLQAQGSVSFVDHALFLSNTVDDSFAIVDTDGLANVRVLNENRPAGRTDATGRLMVPDLRSFDINRISINATDVPVDATIDEAQRDVRPQDRSGVVVKFPIRFSHGALVQMIDEVGHPLPVGSTADLVPGGVDTPVGYDGDVYVQNLKLHNTLAVTRPDGQRCVAAFDYHSAPGDIPTIAGVFCREVRP